MENLLTTKQVIDLLKVDRITVYRMLNDGRLKGVKIGQQWRFPRAAVEKLINGEPAEANPAASEGAPLPVHCIQTVQNLFSDVSRLSALVVNLRGEPITRASGPCAFCQRVQLCPSGLDACLNSWKQFAGAALQGETRFTCHAGLDYTAALVEDNGAPIGLFLIGQYHRQAAKTSRAAELAATHGLDAAELAEAEAHIPSLPARHTSPAEVQGWAAAAVSSIHSILSERSGFMARLQQISNLSQFR